MDFDINSESEETEFNDDLDGNGGNNKKNKKPLDKTTSIIIIVVVSIVSGLCVFFISNALFGKKVEQIPVVAESVPLNLSDENVRILYDYVKYGTRGTRNDKFLVEKSVNIDSFNNQEKFYYALQFAEYSDFFETERVDDQNRKVYTISYNKIKEYMTRFFGTNVSFETDEVITYPFSFRLYGNNVGVMTPSNTGDGYDVVFTEYQADAVEVVKPYYGELVSAVKNPDGSYELTEKVIYTEVEKVGDNYKINVYNDNEHTELLEELTNQNEEMLKKNPINVSKHKSKATTVKYLFKISGGMLCFYSSKIS